MTFYLIGRPTTLFRVVRFLNVAGIPCVYGRTLDDKRQTTARLADITAADETLAKGRAVCAWLLRGKTHNREDQ